MLDGSLPSSGPGGKPKSFDPISFGRFIDFVFPDDGGCLELICFDADVDKTNRIVRSKYPIVLGGWFDKPSGLGDVARRISNVSAYVMINPVASHKVAQIGNRVARIGKGEATSKEDVLCLRHVHIDIDSCRPSSKISATRAELEGALELRDAILAARPEIAANSIWGCSGNGAFILTRIPDLPNDAAGSDRVKKFLAALAHQFNKGWDHPRIDTNTFFPNVHVGLPGTVKAKGDSTPDRPLRGVVVHGGAFKNS